MSACAAPEYDVKMPFLTQIGCPQRAKYLGDLSRPKVVTETVRELLSDVHPSIHPLSEPFIVTRVKGVLSFALHHRHFLASSHN